MDNTKLIVEARSWARGQLPEGPWGEKHVVHRLADALEAAEAELTRRDTVIAEVKLRLNQVYGYAPEDRIRGALLHIEAFEAGRSAAAPVSLEAVKAETTTEWAIARQDSNGELWDVSLLLDDRAEAERERAIWQAEFDADDDPVVIVERTKGIEPGEWRPVSTEGA